ncbi:hypothetical protein [Actinoplanes siamensis]|uniref:hypothetical protein n=1 Tax=Actinoplanes siamensis TaxID=1223317 RepID=UPI0019419E91|nr:hypothetical protein [Actinoplanes siamensis]
MSVPRWMTAAIGPVLVTGLVVFGVVGARYFPEKEKSGPEAIGACHTVAETLRDIRAEPILQQFPRPDRFGEVDDDDIECGAPSPMGAVSRPLTGIMSADEVREFYAGLAERTGWHPFRGSNLVYSATKKAAGGCPWWFVVQPADYGFQLRVIYLPSGVSADQCRWKSEEPQILG